MLSFILIFALLSLGAESLSIQMKVKTPSVGNLPRKIKRLTRSLTSESFDKVYTPEFDKFLTSEASPAIYDSLMKIITKTARQLKVSVKKEFGLRTVTVRPDIVDTAIAAGTFQVNFDSFI